MAFENRIVEHPGRVVLTPVSGETNTFDADYTSAEGAVTQEGTKLNATEMNEAVQDLIDSSMSGIELTPGGTLKVKNIQCGDVSVNAVANTIVSAQVTFSPAFENVPRIVATAISGVPTSVSVTVGSRSTTGFTLYVNSTTTASRTINWIAIGK